MEITANQRLPQFLVLLCIIVQHSDQIVAETIHRVSKFSKPTCPFSVILQKIYHDVLTNSYSNNRRQIAYQKTNKQETNSGLLLVLNQEIKGARKESKTWRSSQ